MLEYNTNVNLSLYNSSTMFTKNTGNTLMDRFDSKSGMKGLDVYVNI